MVEEKRSEAEILVEHAPVPLALVRQGVIVRVNPAMAELFGQEADALVGRQWDAFRTEIFDGAVDYCAEGVTHCLRLRTGAGHAFWATLHGAAMDEAAPHRGVVWSIQDVTAQKQAADALQQARLAADQATRAKGEFLATMSHEIRTPMGVIIGMTALALEQEGDGQQRQRLRTVKESAEALLGLLNDILDYSKIEGGHLRLEEKPFDFVALVEGVVSGFSHLARQKGLAFTHRIDMAPGQVPVGDAFRLRQILVNLVNNALKFTHEGGVTLLATLAAAGEEGLTATFRVTDTGIGIAEENQQHIFARFAQEDSSTSRRYGGTGLGLAICRQVVAQMRGSMALESSPGRGSVFSFTVPLARQHRCCQASGPESTVAEGAAPAPKPRPRQVLVADDHPANQELARVLLEQAGHVVTVAATGVEALACLAEARFDHVLMDIQMPELDGLAATRLIRRLERGDEVSIPGLDAAKHAGLRRRLAGGRLHLIALTANAMAGEQEQCRLAGLDHSLGKPYEKEALLALVAGGGECCRCREEAGTAAVPAPPMPLDKVCRDRVWHHIATAFGTSKETTDLVVATYAGSLAEHLAALRAALGEKDFQQMTFHAHAVKGAFLNMGLKDLAHIAQEMESRAPLGDDAGFGALVSSLAAALEPFLESRTAQ
jgi:hypothetical protein